MNERTFKSNLKAPSDGSTTSPKTAELSSSTDLSDTRKKVYVVEDHALMRRSIIEAVERETDLTVCGHAANAQEALAAIKSLRPDVVLTDIQLKSSSGLDLIKELRMQAPSVPVIATTMFDMRRTERLARAAGASGFVAKQDGPEKLVAAVHDLLKSGKDIGGGI